MKCFKHTARDACGFCNECGKALCSECAQAFEPVLCSECALKRSSNNTVGTVKTIMIKSVIYFVLSFILFKVIFSSAETKADFGMLLTTSLFISGIPWGWSFLSRKFPLVVFGNGKFLIMYLLLKLVVAYFIGIFIMLWNFVKIPYLLHKGRKEREHFQQIHNHLADPINKQTD